MTFEDKLANSVITFLNTCSEFENSPRPLSDEWCDVEKLVQFFSTPDQMVKVNGSLMNTRMFNGYSSSPKSEVDHFIVELSPANTAGHTRYLRFTYGVENGRPLNKYVSVNEVTPVLKSMFRTIVANER